MIRSTLFALCTCLSLGAAANSEAEKVYGAMLASIAYPKELVANVVDSCSSTFPQLASELSTAQARWLEKNKSQLTQLATKVEEARRTKPGFDKSASEALKSTLRDTNARIQQIGAGECSKMISWLNSDEFAQTNRKLGFTK